MASAVAVAITEACAAVCATACATACAREIATIICSGFSIFFQCFRSNGGQTTSGPHSGGQTTAGPNHGKQKKAGQSSGGQTNSDMKIIAASDLEIEHLHNSENWKKLGVDPSEPRFKGVVKLVNTYFFYIKTSKNFLGLSPNTKYGAYLIYKTENDSKGLDAILKSTVSVGIEQNDTRYVCLKPSSLTSDKAGKPKKRSDGWMELELGKFKCDKATADKVAQIIIKDETRSTNEKYGLKIAGIECRPI